MVSVPDNPALPEKVGVYVLPLGYAAESAPGLASSAISSGLPLKVQAHILRWVLAHSVKSMTETSPFNDRWSWAVLPQKQGVHSA